MREPFPETRLALSIGFADTAVVSVAGDLDLATAPDLGAVLEALIERGHHHIAIDCSELAFIDASGIGVITAAHDQVTRTHGAIEVRGLSGLAYRLFEITGLLEPFHVAGPDPAIGRGLHDEPDPVASQVARLVAASARADAVADTYSRMTSLIPRIVTACDGASVTLWRRDHLITAAASNETVRALDDIQYSGGEGPCLDAANEGVQTHAGTLADEPRWRSFTPRARERGIESILSSPLLVDDAAAGALNLYSRTPNGFSTIDQDLAHVFADQAALLLSDANPAMPDQRIHDALASRDLIAQAQGVVMERLGLNALEALASLREESVSASTLMRTRAGAVVAETQTRRASPEPSGPANE